MNKELIQKLMTGLLAKLVRYALATAGGATLLKALPADAPVDPMAISVGVVEIVFPLLWSWWEDRVRSNQTVRALTQVAAGASPAEATANTTTLKKIEEPPTTP